MIRREIQFADTAKQWLLISQVEHARLSGILAEHCLHNLGQLQSHEINANDLQGVRQELTSAIVHHDDGWAAWEAQPQLDAQQGRPLSFLEYPLDQSLSIWSESVRMAKSLGNLAAWVVAGHFMILLSASTDNCDKPAAKAWLAEMTERRQHWLARWQSQQPDLNTLELAEEALLWLRLCDILSLWTCMTCPSLGETVDTWPDAYVCAAGLPLETTLTLISPSEVAATTEPLLIQVDPWRFDVDEILLEAVGQTVPVQKYSQSKQLIATHQQHRLSWRLVPTAL